MLELKPQLGWRDVQAILAVTSRKFDNEDDSWTINAAGISHSYKYGFGIISATGTKFFALSSKVSVFQFSCDIQR